jgi:hypothetical protein
MSYTSKYPKFNGVNILAAGIAKFFNAASNHFIGIKAGTVTTDKTFTLPDGDGAPNQALKTDGSGNLGWMSVGSGGVNYISNYDFEGTANASAPAGWVRYADAAGAVPVNGTGGSPDAGFTFLASTSSPIRGTVSAVLTKDAADRQGHGISYDFSISAVDCNKTLSVSLDQVTGGTYVAGDLAVFLYDVTNSVLITPQPSALQPGTATFGASFLTTASTSYRLIVHVASTSSSAYTLKLDSVIVGPGSLVQGAAVDNWKTYSGTIAWTTSPTTNTGRWRRVGDSMEIRYRVVLSGAISAAIEFPLPSGFTRDNSKQTDTGNGGDVFGVARGYNASTGNFYVGSVTGGSTTSRVSVRAAGSTAWNGSVPFGEAYDSGDEVSGVFTVPIAEWSSSVYLGQEGVQYASNSDYTTDGDVTAATTVPGASGSPVLNFTPTAATVSRKVTFGQISANDDIQVELSVDRVTWLKAGSLMTSGRTVAPYGESTFAYGIGIRQSSSTEVSVTFGKYRANLNSLLWGDLTTTYWRVKKISAPALVGFSIATSTNPGLIDYYATGQFVTTVTNLNATPPAITMNWARVGKIVTISSTASISDASKANTSNPALTDALPTALRPAANRWVTASIRDNNVYSSGIAVVNTAGVITWYKDPSATAWTASQPVMVTQFTFSYSVE